MTAHSLSSDQLRRLTTWGTSQTASFLDEFRRFALKGNVVDLAIGVVIGAAFGKIIDSWVKNIMMPLISLLVPSQQSYLGWKLTIGAKEIPYGLFLGDVLNFAVVALALFIFAVKFLGWVSRRRSAEETIPAPAAPASEVELLCEIRDLLRTRSHGTPVTTSADYLATDGPR